MIKLLFDLRTTELDDLTEELTQLMDAGYTPEMEKALAKYAGKIVEVTFRERRPRNRRTG